MEVINFDSPLNDSRQLEWCTPQICNSFFADNFVRKGRRVLPKSVTYFLTKKQVSGDTEVDVLIMGRILGDSDHGKDIG